MTSTAATGVRFPVRTTTIPPEVGSRTPPQYDTWEVVDDLDDLRGPESGVLEVPLAIHWGPGRRFNLDDSARRLTAYQTILREATTGAQLSQLLSRRLLIESWRELRLPPRLRAGWEQAHPELVGAAA